MQYAFRPEQYEPATWRLLQSGYLDGPGNVALDEAILEAVAAGESSPTVRCYGWRPAGLSIGREQPWDLFDWDACAATGWEIVRRSSDGRAILHTDDICFSLCLPAADPRVQGEEPERFRRLAEGVRAGLKPLGLDPARTRSYYQDRGRPGAAFFDGPAPGDVLVAQNKLVANVQVRRSGALLQQGAIPLGGDITRIAEALYFDLPGQRMAVQSRLHYRATTLEDCLGRPVGYDEAAAALARGFAQALNLTLEEGAPSAREQARAAELRTARYANEAWTRSV